MSKIFNYSHLKDVLNKDAYIPGQLGKISGNEQVGVALVKTGEVVEDGEFVKISTVENTIVCEPIANNDAVSSVYGVVIKDVHAQRFGGQTGFIYDYKGQNVSVLRTGYVWVPVQDDGAITAGAKVYIRVKTDAVNGRAVGSIETAADSTNVVELPGATFTGRVGFALSSTKAKTDSTGLTGRTALVKLELGILA